MRQGSAHLHSDAVTGTVHTDSVYGDGGGDAELFVIEEFNPASG